jgi:hypothetical protein
MLWPCDDGSSAVWLMDDTHATDVVVISIAPDRAPGNAAA